MANLLVAIWLYLGYNVVMEDLKDIIANNITRFRTALGITQLELASLLNYSDKSISKWERGLGIPDVVVLKRMAEIFGTTVDEFLTKHEEEKIKLQPDKKSIKARKILITLLAIAGVWLVATFTYVVLTWLSVRGAWKCFIYAVPATFIVSTVFSAIWGIGWGTAISISLLNWTTLLSIFLTFIGTRAWLLFFIGIPIQVLVILWCILATIIRKKRKITQPTE